MQHNRRHGVLLRAAHHPGAQRVEDDDVGEFADRQAPDLGLHAHRPRAVDGAEVEGLLDCRVELRRDLACGDERRVVEPATALQGDAHLGGDAGAVVGVAVYAEGALGLDGEGGVEADGRAETHLELGGGRAGDVGGVREEEGGVLRGGVGGVGEEDGGAKEAVGFHERGDGVSAWRFVMLEVEKGREGGLGWYVRPG